MTRIGGTGLEASRARHGARATRCSDGPDPMPGQGWPNARFLLPLLPRDAHQPEGGFLCADLSVNQKLQPGRVAGGLLS